MEDNFNEEVKIRIYSSISNYLEDFCLSIQTFREDKAVLHEDIKFLTGGDIISKFRENIEYFLYYYLLP